MHSGRILHLEGRWTARFHDAELQHSDYFLITHGRSTTPNRWITIDDLNDDMESWLGTVDFQYGWISRINLARNNVQLPTPHLSPYLNTDFPICPWVSIFDPNDHHPNRLRHIAFNHHVRPWCLRSIFEDHRPRNGTTSPSPIHPEVETVTSVDTITPDFSPPAVPHHGTSIDFQPTPTVTPVVSELSAPVYNNVAIASIIPTDPLFPPCLRPQRPYHVGEDITEVGRERAYQGRRSGWHLLLDHLPYGQHRSRIFNASRPRSCDRS